MSSNLYYLGVIQFLRVVYSHAGGASQAVTSVALVAVQFKGGRDPVAAGGERLVGNTESSLRE